MARSPSPKRRRTEDRERESSRDRDPSYQRDRERDRGDRTTKDRRGSDRDSLRDREKDREKDKDRDRERDRDYRSSRDADRDSRDSVDRDRHKDRRSHRSSRATEHRSSRDDYKSSSSRRHRSRSRSNSPNPHSRRARSPTPTHSSHSSPRRSQPPQSLPSNGDDNYTYDHRRRPSPVPQELPAKPSFVSTFSTAPSTPSPAPATTTQAPSTSKAEEAENKRRDDEEEKQKIKREKLAAWKAKNAAKAALAASAPAPPAPVATNSAQTPKQTLPAKPLTLGTATVPVNGIKQGLPPKPATVDPAAQALAAAAAISSRLLPPASGLTTTAKLPPSLPAKPSFSFSTARTTPLVGVGGGKKAMALGGEDDDGKKRIGMVRIEGDVDLSMDVTGEGDAGDEDDDEDLEGGVVYAQREGGRGGDAEEADVKMEVDETPVEAAGVVVPAVIEEEEEDELEKFMMGVQKMVKTVDKQDKAKLSTPTNGSGKAKKEEIDDDDDDEDVGVSEDEAEKVGMSAADILALAAKKVRRGRELPSVDHLKINYEPFRKAFYHPPPEVDAMTPEEVEELRLELDGIKVRGVDPPKPVAKWSWCGLPVTCIEVIKQLDYAAPTSIQAQAIPAIMSGRDIIGVAKTGSGKTMAFILPMFRHIKDQRPIKTMEGPIAMIMTPTRELATQIHRECRPFLKALGLRASCAYGGTPLKDNIADMKRGSEVIVCTPGRMIELLTTNSGRVINLQRITYLVLDEADRMFDMGFEPQVMKIINQIRPDRQTVLFSATFPRQMEALARKILRRPLEITVGGRSVVAPEIEQIVEVRTEETKFNRLLELLGRLTNDDPDARALIFVERQDGADKLLTELLRKSYACMSLHGGMDQVDRDQTIADFKTGTVPIVIATSVAARGLDVKQLKLVVQYDAPNHMEDYVHRAGRTGRAGNKGTCVTFVTPDQDRYALDIFKALQASDAKIPDELKALAEVFAEKVKSGKASAGSGFGGKGLERLDSDRDALSRAERAMFGEVAGEKISDETTGGVTSGVAGGEVGAANVGAEVADLEVEIKRGPAPDLSRKGPGNLLSSNDANQNAAQLAVMKAAEAAAIAAGKPAGVAKAQSVIANFNAMLKAKSHAKTIEHDLSTDAARRRDPDATDYHAIIYINDYPQKARWKVTNKETMVQLVESTGASITNKGVYYEPGKEPGPDELPKLHLLIESNDEFRVKQAITEIKRALIEGATMALEAEQRNPGTAPGRYNVI